MALSESGGSAWPEYVGSDRVHSGINSGAAGTGWFLHDLGLATGDSSFSGAAEGTQTGSPRPLSRPATG